MIKYDRIIIVHYDPYIIRSTSFRINGCRLIFEF